jgi:hypothetical protein
MAAEDRDVGTTLGTPFFSPCYLRYLRRLNVSTVRAARYRRLALREPDIEKARILLQLAEEAERGTLCTVDQLSGSRLAITDSSYKAPENPETKWYYR